MQNKIIEEDFDVHLRTYVPTAYPAVSQRRFNEKDNGLKILEKRLYY